LISGLCAGRRCRVQIKIAAAHRLRRARTAASNPQGNSKYYDGRVSSVTDCLAQHRACVARSYAVAGVAGRRRRAIFDWPLGHRRFSVKGSQFELIEDEDG